MTTLPRWNRVQGDALDILDWDLDGILNLDAATGVTARVWRTVAPVSSTALTGSVLDSSTATVRIALGAWLLTAAPGTWYIKVKVTFTGGESRSWPTGGDGKIIVDPAPPTS